LFAESAAAEEHLLLPSMLAFRYRRIPICFSIAFIQVPQTTLAEKRIENLHCRLQSTTMRVVVTWVCLLLVPIVVHFEAVAVADAFLLPKIKIRLSSFPTTSTSLQHAYDPEGRRRPRQPSPLRVTFDDNHNPSNPDPRRHQDNNVPESGRRRQLLYSLLAAAGSSTFLPVHATDAAETTTTLIDNAVSPSSNMNNVVDGSRIDIMKPPLDDREYRVDVLDNGLRIVLCSDPSSNEAGAAMDVHVGACSDPIDIPGLAHFNERKYCSFNVKGAVVCCSILRADQRVCCP
jgi:hypothetical protein